MAFQGIAQSSKPTWSGLGVKLYIPRHLIVACFGGRLRSGLLAGYAAI